MTRDLAVLLGCLLMLSLYTAYTVGYEQGEGYAHKECPIQKGVVLKNITEEKGEVRCTYTTTPAVRQSVFARRAAL